MHASTASMLTANARYVTAVTLVVACVSCGTRDAAQGSMTSMDSAGVQITTVHVAPADVAEWSLTAMPSLTISAATVGDSTAFAEVGSVSWLDDGRIVVADVAARRLLLFDASGTLAASFGRAGAGPGEFRGLGSVHAVTGDSIAAFDGRLRRLSVFHPDTGYVRSVHVGGTSDESWPEQAWLWHGGRIVVLQLGVTPLDSIPAAAGVRRWPMRARLTMTDSSGQVLGTSPPFAGMYTALDDRGDARVPFSNRPFAALALDRVYFGSGSSFTLSYVDSAFTWAGEVRWPAQRENLTQAEIDAVRDEAHAMAAARRLPPERLAAMFATSFAPAMQPTERPAIGRVLVDATGRVWIERFEATRLGSALQKAGERWTVLSRDGEPLARLRLPVNTRLEAVRDDRVLLVVRDSLDVQSVAVHTIVRR